MAKKKKGYVELYWTCPNCEGENLGSVTTCGNCGKPQPDKVEFHQGSHQKIVKDAEKVKRAKAGADIHCAFCGTRNPGTAKVCSQCGSDLGEGAKRESAGKVVGAFKAGKGARIECPNCGTKNPYKNRKCENCGTALSHKVAEKSPKAGASKAGSKRSPALLIGGAVIVIFAIIYFLFIRTSDVSGVVTGVEWQRAVVIEDFGEVEREDWLDEIPDGGEVYDCNEEVRRTQDQAPSSGRYDEVCGTPYNVETGGGFAEVVQDCEYQVYDEMCSYTVMDWAAVSTMEVEGFDLSPEWPAAALSDVRREGERSESYVCIFDVDGERREYTADSESEFEECEIGTTWTLAINTVGAVISIER